MTEQTQPGDGVVHETTETLERPPEPPPSGPWLWARENLFSGETPVAVGANALLTVLFGLIAVGLIRYALGFYFAEERRWEAVTANMKLLMVQAFPQDDLGRIWISIGILFVLVAWTLAAWGVGGRISIHTVATGVRAAAVFLLFVTIIHPFNPPSTPRIGLAVLAVVGIVAGHAATRAYTARKEETIPFLSLLMLGMAAVIAVIWTIQLPVATGPFEAGQAGIASTTTWPWTILLVLTVVAYFVGKAVPAGLTDRFRRLLTLLWVFSYPVIIMIIQRNPILDWSDILGFGETPFLRSDLGSTLLFGLIGALLVFWLALPQQIPAGKALVFIVGLAIAATAWLVPEGSTTIRVLATITGLGLGLLALFGVDDPAELARIVGFQWAILALLVWFVPMPFLYRALVIAFALVAVAAPTFGGTQAGRQRMVLAWIGSVVLIVATFRLGAAETALEFSGTTFLGGFNLTILLAITGVVLSFPIGVVLALARTSTMPIFRLLATGYIELVRSVPLITWLFFGSVMLALFLPGGVEFDEIVRIVAAVTIFSAAYVAENVRGGLQSVNKGQYEASRAMGLSVVQSTTLIILPQAIRAVIPALVGSVIVAFKDTSLVAIIGLADILWIARTAIPSQTTPFNFLGTQAQMMFFMALFYWIFTFTFSRLSLRYEKRLGLGER